MKKHFILGIMALAALASCTKSEVLNQGSQTEKGVSFTSYVGKATQTKAATLNTEIVAEQGIGVLAWRTGSDNASEALLDKDAPAFMNNFKLYSNDDGDTWTYTPQRYWPSTGALVSFYAYAPYIDPAVTYDDDDEYGRKNITINQVTDDPSTTEIIENGGQYIITLNVPKNDIGVTPEVNTGSAYEYQTDFMVSRKGNETAAGYNQNLNKDFNDDVHLQMKHALSKISFVAKAGDKDEDERYEYTKVIINNLKITGNFANSGNYNLFSEKWSIDPANLHTEYNYVNNADAATNATNDNDPFTAVADELINSSSYTEYKDGWYYLTKTENDLMVIPFVNETTPANIANVSGTYTIYTYTDAAMTQVYDQDEVPFYTDVNLNLEEGKHYIFQLDIELKKITFSVEVEDWTETTPVDVLTAAIQKSYFVNDASYGLLPDSFGIDPTNLPNDFPWLVVEFAPTKFSKLNINVTGPDGTVYNNVLTNLVNYADLVANDPTVKILTLTASEIGVPSLTAGDWTVTINNKSTVITVQ